MKSHTTGWKLKLFAVLGWGVAATLIVVSLNEGRSPGDSTDLVGNDLPAQAASPTPVLAVPTPSFVRSPVEVDRLTQVIRAAPVPTFISPYQPSVPTAALPIRRVTPVPLATLPLPAIPEPPALMTDPIPTIVPVTRSTLRPIPTVAPTGRAPTATQVPFTPTPLPTAAPTIQPTLVPQDSAFKVAQTIETLLGNRVDITVEGFGDNRLRFDQLVYAINEEEQLLGVPYPAPRVDMRRVPTVSGGFCGNNQMSYESRYSSNPYTVKSAVIRIREDSTCTDTFGSIVHEVAHTWFHGNDPQDWVDEGLANALELQVKELTPGEAELYPPRTYCASYGNIQELERSVPLKENTEGAEGYICNYRLGDGIFGSLRNHHGAEDFNRRIAGLARQSVNKTNLPHDIDDVREAFGLDRGSLEIIDRWYSGTPDMRIYRHLDQVTYIQPPILDGEYIQFSGRTERPGMVLDLILGNDPYCSQFSLYEGLADPTPLSGLSDPLPVGWSHNEVPDAVVISHEITPATGDFTVTARMSNPSILTAMDLSLQVHSQVETGADGRCMESIHFSQVKVEQGKIPDYMKEVKHYHDDLIQWDYPPRVRNYQIRLEGKAPPNSLAFKWRDDYCVQFYLHSHSNRGYQFLEIVYPILSAGYSWNETPGAEITEARTWSDGKFEAVIEIWDKSLLSHDSLVLVARSPAKRISGTNQCESRGALSAVTIN